jgi:hypothetical protein
MRRTILLSLFALLCANEAHDACAQRRGGTAPGFARGGYGFSRARSVPRYGLGYGYLPYGSGYGYPADEFGAGYSYAPQPALYVQRPPVFVQPPAPPVVETPVHPVMTEYKWQAAEAASSPQGSATGSGSEPQDFGIVLKDGSTLSAVMVYAAYDGLHYIDPDEKHLRISMSEVDRAATLKLNRERNLNLHLPAAQ